MAELVAVDPGTVSLRVTCDARGCPAVAGAATPVAVGETAATALARCRGIVATRWLLAPGVTLCGQCAHHQRHYQPTLVGL